MLDKPFRLAAKKSPRLPVVKQRCIRLAILFAVASPWSASVVQASTIEGVNHTHWAINRFSVDGRSGIDTIGPYQGGGGACCYVAPEHWVPNMTVRVNWETGVGNTDDFPGFADEQKYLAWRDAVRSQNESVSFFVCGPITACRQAGQAFTRSA
ncbi:DUF3304 domain-containing protein, partial [Pseudomonas urmiensis]|uniref:DUF3304 domain-containing protein n=1 Tax=Pseudomonas urmiensis TaxID=2745493 RepID=UPI003D14FC1D